MHLFGNLLIMPIELSFEIFRFGNARGEEKYLLCHSHAWRNLVSHRIKSFGRKNRWNVPSRWKVIQTNTSKKVSKDHVHVLLFNLGCFVNHRGDTWIKREMEMSNNCISSDMENSRFHSVERIASTSNEFHEMLMQDYWPMSNFNFLRITDFIATI